MNLAEQLKKIADTENQTSIYKDIVDACRAAAREGEYSLQFDTEGGDVRLLQKLRSDGLKVQRQGTSKTITISWSDA